MLKGIKEKIRIALIIILTLSAVSALLSLTKQFSIFQALRIVFGSIYVLFLPGYLLSYVFFPETKKDDNRKEKGIDWLERIVLSFALSIAIIPLLVFYFNLAGIKITALNTSLVILGVIFLISGVLIALRRR